MSAVNVRRRMPASQADLAFARVGARTPGGFGELCHWT